MSILFSQKLGQNNEIRPQEAIFTEVLSTIAVTPKMLYFYGKMPENRVKNVVKFTTKSGVERAENCLNYDTKMQAKMVNGSLKQVPEWVTEGQLARPKSLAIVGTRKPTAYGREIAYNLAYAAARQGVVVISGLAYGIDSIAHRGALDAGGVTVAVLGTPIDQIYPRAHLGLAEEIIEKSGCILSELAPGAKFYAKACFLQRNRLISGLADVVVIPEAAERSGSLNTAAHALEQGREIFAVPGDITRPMSAGCNRLIRQGAMPYLGVEDVLEVLFPERIVSKKVVKQQNRAPGAAKIAKKAEMVDAHMELWPTSNAVGDVEWSKSARNNKVRCEGALLVDEVLEGSTAAETAILRALASGMRDGEEILAKTGLKTAEFNHTVTMLELSDRIRSLGANRWCLK